MTCSTEPRLLGQRLIARMGCQMTNPSELEALQLALIETGLQGEGQARGGWFSLFQRGPGHFDYADVTFRYLNLETSEVQHLAHEGAKLMLASRSTLDAGFAETLFVKSTQDAYILAAISERTTPSMTTVRSFVAENAKAMSEWLNSPGSATFVRIYIQPGISLNSHSLPGGWDLIRETWPIISLNAVRRGQRREDALLWSLDTLSIQRPLQPDETDRDAVLRNCELFVLAMSLGLRLPLSIEDIRFQATPWRNAPDVRFADPSRIRGHGWSDPRRAQARVMYSPDPNLFMSGADAVAMRRCEEWWAALKSAPRLHYSLKVIVEGLGRITSASSLPEFKVRTELLESCFAVLSGMEGMSLGRRHHHGGGAGLTFRETWAHVWRRSSAGTILEKSPIAPVDALKQLYGFRSAIAHADERSIDTQAALTYAALGAFWVSPSSVQGAALCLYETVWVLLDTIRTEPALLTWLTT